jgi:hypothetical protein
MNQQRTAINEVSFVPLHYCPKAPAVGDSALLVAQDFWIMSGTVLTCQRIHLLFYFVNFVKRHTGDL